MTKNTLTQQGASRRDRTALTRAEKNGLSEGDLIKKMAETHSEPNTAKAFLEATGAIIHTKANMAKESPIYEALEEILQEQKEIKTNGSTA